MWITGQVWDDGGGGLADVRIELSGSELLTRIREAVTDAQGRFVLQDLKPGTYVLRFSRHGFSTAVREVVVAAEGLAATVCAQLRSLGTFR